MGVVNAHVHSDLLAYAEHRLSAQRQAQVAAHLAECARCQAAAADTAALVDALQAAPAALRRLERGAAQHWPAVWARAAAPVLRPALSRSVPRLSFYVSLLAVAFSASTLLPGNFGLQPAVTAGVVETPVTISLTPRAGLDGQSDLVTLAGLSVSVSTNATAAAGASLAATPAGPAPAPTPKTGP
jgi:anti-sigma factor RsiW